VKEKQKGKHVTDEENLSKEKLAKVIKEAPKKEKTIDSSLLEKIKNWLPESGLPYNIFSDDKKPPQAMFATTVGDPLKVVIYVPKKAPDRIVFQGQINFSQKDRDRTRNMKHEKYNDFVFTLTEKLALLGCDWKFDTNGQQLNGLMYHIFLYEDALSKNQFFQKLNRIQVVHSQILRTINYILGIKDSKTPSGSGSSIYG